MTTRNSVKRESIVQYWRNEIEKKVNINWDKALTNCWACGNNFGGSLEKCHIIPDILGGEMKVDNMVLMCQFCNKQNPETVYYEDFWLWLNSRIEKGFISIHDHPLAMEKEYTLMYGINPREMMSTYFENMKKPIEEIKFLQEDFQEEFIDYLENNEDKFYIRYPATAAVAFDKFIRIWVNNDDTNMEEECVIKTLPKIGSAKFNATFAIKK